MQEYDRNACVMQSYENQESHASEYGIAFHQRTVKMRLMQKKRCLKWVHLCTIIWLQTYYTLFFTKIQAFLAKTAFFVDIDGYLCQLFYVNPLAITGAVLYHFRFQNNI